MSSSLLDNLLGEIKICMKAGEKEKLTCLRGLHSDIKNISINQKKDITDDLVGEAAGKAVKQRNESIEQFKKGDRMDLVSQNENEIVWITPYQPSQLSEEEVEKIVEESVSASGASGPQEMGKVMGILMPKVKGKADGKLVSQLVQKKLSQL